MFYPIVATFFSFFINSLFLFLLIFGLSFSIKKSEEGKVIWLDLSSPPLGNLQENLKKEEPLPTPHFVPLTKPLSAEKKTAALAKRERALRDEEESFLKERLAKLSQVEKTKEALEERSYLERRLKELKKDDERGLSQTSDTKEVQNFPSSPPSAKEISFNLGFPEGKLSKDYFLLIKRQLQSHFEVPIYLKSKKDLRALVEIEITPSGDIIKINFLKKAEDPSFNQAIERCLRSVKILPPNQKLSLKIEFRTEGISRIS